jgi:hypothetical protein
MDNDTRIIALGQDIYLARHDQMNGVVGSDLTDFENQTISQVNQFLPELEKEADWNFSRTNDDPSLGTIPNGTTISYSLPDTIRKLVLNSQRDLTIQQDGTIISTFKLVNPNQAFDPTDNDVRSRATVVNRKVVFGRSLNATEIGGTIVADTIAWMPRLSTTDVDLLDLLDDNPDIRQLVVLGVLKNQILPDIVQGGLAPAFTTKYASLLKECVAENNASTEADYGNHDDFSWVGGVGF